MNKCSGQRDSGASSPGFTSVHNHGQVTRCVVLAFFGGDVKGRERAGRKTAEDVLGHLGKSQEAMREKD